MYIDRLLKLNDYRIDGYLKIITFLNDRIMEVDIRIKDMVKHDPNAQLLESIHGVGKFTALVLSSEIDKIDRFPDSHKLCAYAGIVPSVRNSVNAIHHPHSTCGHQTVTHFSCNYHVWDTDDVYSDMTQKGVQYDREIA